MEESKKQRSSSSPPAFTGMAGAQPVAAQSVNAQHATVQSVSAQPVEAQQSGQSVAAQPVTVQQGGQQQTIPFGDTASMWVAFVSRTDQNAPTEDECALKAEAVAERVVREFNPGKEIGFLSGWRRRRAFKPKKLLHDSATAEKWRAEKQAAPKNQASDQMSFSNPVNLSPAARQAFYEMMNEKTDFLGYTDDRVLVSKFPELYGKLEKYEKINRGLADPAWSADNVAETLKAYPFLDKFTVDDIRKKADHYASVKAFYEAKMDMISNPFYMLLRKTDTDTMDENALAEKADEFKVTSPELSAYLDAMRRLKQLEDKKVVRKPADFSAALRADIGDGLESNTKGHVAIGTVRKSLTVTGPKYGNGFYGGKIKDLEGTEKDRKYTGDSDVHHDGALEAEASITATLVEGKVETTSDVGKYGTGKAGADFQGLEVRAYGKVGASIFDTLVKKEDGSEEKERRIDGYIGAEVGASATAIKGKVTASLVADKFKWHEKIPFLKKFEALKKIKLIGISGSLSGDALKASATAYAKAGKFSESKEVTKTGEDGSTKTEKEDVLAEGFGVKAGVSASLLSGKGKLELTILGVKIGVSATANLGSVGASVGFAAKNGKIGASLSANLGVGFKLGFYIDASAWIDLIKDEIIEKTAPVRRMIKKDFDDWLNERAEWFKSKLGIKTRDEQGRQLETETMADRVAKRFELIEQRAETKRKEALDRLAASNEEYAKALQWQSDYTETQGSLLGNDKAEVEQKVVNAQIAERGLLAQTGNNIRRRTSAFVDPPAMINMGDSAFKAGELESNVSSEPLFGVSGTELDADTISQRKEVNDCYLIGVIAGLARTDPDYITQTLVRQDPADASMAQVRLYDEKGDPQVIRLKKTGIRGDRRPLWLQLVEKAALTLVGRYEGTGSAVFRYGRTAGKDWASHTFEDGKTEFSELNMGWETTAYMLLFGKACRSMQIAKKDNPPKSLSEAGNEAVGKALAWLEAGKQVTASTGSFGNVNERLRTKLRSTHVYTVLGEGNPIQGERTLEIRDPYADRGINGVFDITFREFMSFFTNVCTTA